MPANELRRCVVCLHMDSARQLDSCMVSIDKLTRANRFISDSFPAKGVCGVGKSTRVCERQTVSVEAVANKRCNRLQHGRACFCS